MQDSVRVTLPKNATVPSAIKRLEKCGDVASHDRRFDRSRNIDVIFYDVRCAADACDVIGESCKLLPNPSKLTRKVLLPGTVQIDVADIDRVSNVQADDDSGAFTVEFFDARDAARYIKAAERAKAAEEAVDGVEPPPGLQAQARAGPPGLCLPPGLAGPPGLCPAAEFPSSPKERSKSARFTEETASCGSEESLHFRSHAASSSSDDEPKEEPKDAAAPLGPQVKLRGLPNAMLCDELMSTMLQQAGLEAFVLDIAMQYGEKGTQGEVVLTLANWFVADKCLHHFHGRQWGTSVVTAEMVMPPFNAESAAAALAAAASLPPMSATAAEFVPSGMLSASAPEFVPGGSAAVPAASEAKALPREKRRTSSSLRNPASSASTEIGDSGTEEDKEDKEDNVRNRTCI
eukprot:TRINITY_DN83138_c0_g1_i1.p1 TRINITY_DN83138_c0_g1~~TRINITY_DN83138_c0_g1_i1.p1  ORF type:complete len:404 (+),score=80.26 TRINITY_DN83138_c0_g1_i1:110-1321(+)